MAKAAIKLPVGLVGSEGPPELEYKGGTLREALDDCVAKEPRLKSCIFRDGGGVWGGVFVNGRNMRQLGGMDTPLADGDLIKLVPPISGG